MRLPIRIRLTAWYVAVLALVITALGAFVVVRLRADLTADFDRSLRSAGAEIRSGYERGGPARFSSTSGSVVSVLPADSGAQLVTRQGRLLGAIGRDLPRAPLLGPAERRRVLAGAELVRTAHGRTDSEPFRVYATVVRRGGERDALVVASSLEGVESAVHRVLVLLLIAGPAALLAVAAGGWWLARAALRPVDRLTHQAERIEVDRLDERVSVPATSDEVAHLAATLNRMLDRLRRGVEDKRRLVADASHELRTPLAVMRSELDVALDYEDLEPDARAVLSSAREEVARMTRTVENLLTLARADEGRLDLLRRPFALRAVVDEVAADLGPIAGEKGVTLVAAGDDAVVDADRDRIRQVVANLVDNAVKYSPPGGVVRTEAWREDGEAGLRVSDDGLGIPADALPHVFDRFYRVDSTRVRASGGSGLGLAICHEIVTAHGGRIWAESDEGHGSRFSLTLPAAS
ncbi:MAG: two-component system, OmpR family, sensor kinase [Thermoleophilaceae bacterium]|nr:two-component system, OmpR family, sensor kinase [Thermoleophilaceae bacterium]